MSNNARRSSAVINKDDIKKPKHSEYPNFKELEKPSNKHAQYFDLLKMLRFPLNNYLSKQTLSQGTTIKGAEQF